MRQDPQDYSEGGNDDIENDSGGYQNNKNSKARMFIYAIAVVGGLLVVVLAAILCECWKTILLSQVLNIF